MTGSLEFIGGKELEAKLKQLETELSARRVGQAALRKAARPIVDKAKSMVPQDQGNLRDAIKAGATRRRKGSDGQQVWLSVGIDMNVQPPAMVGKQSGGQYRDPGVVGVAVIQEFGTPKMAANPFMLPAWDSEKGSTPDRIGKELKAALDRTLQRLAKKLK
ncbi:HK97-gp10 family putative phage morphogenesis protein [Allopontixanthobacter sp.]|uniref:HK97-gp10 family putative phage morphogenesis protein n=1 Tax=Allopontixanthobacter sp. TaxID=2906452 RepID=UPI002ABA0EDB|nr:HK97-gp10 family putative phage morphogenesis protein [Allopontixanthobacter sp.]MDZ4307171.1 HK97-gp10 family putative phage morphogenesis protein [Allopontixanthobacter sp.]